MAVVLPQGALFRKAAEGNIRTALLKEDLIEAVIGLAPNLFYGTQLAGCVVILRRKKPVARRKKVLIIDASRLFRKGRAQNFLDPEHSEQIVAWYRAFEDVEDSRQGRVARRDQEGRLDAEHLALRAAADRRGHPAAARGRRGVQDRAGRGASRRGSPAHGADRRRVAASERASVPEGTRVASLGRRHAAARPDRRERLQAVHLPAALLQAPERRLGRGLPAGVRGDERRGLRCRHRQRPLRDSRRRALEGCAHRLARCRAGAAERLPGHRSRQSRAAAAASSAMRPGPTRPRCPTARSRT